MPIVVIVTLGESSQPVKEKNMHKSLEDLMYCHTVSYIEVHLSYQTEVRHGNSSRQKSHQILFK